MLNPLEDVPVLLGESIDALKDGDLLSLFSLGCGDHESVNHELAHSGLLPMRGVQTLDAFG
ncbi:MAG: hypothetical protein ACK5ZU_03060 [Acidobacteriota bacterium]